MADERERDLVLSPNEFAYVLDKGKGSVSCVCGPTTTSLSNSNALVVFDQKAKKFVEAPASQAITLNVVVPENWYAVLKNPSLKDEHPRAGVSNNLPDLNIGKKVVISGNVSFALYPGQMAKVIQGHTLRSNQYLLTRVYDAEALDGDQIVGQLSIIKGTEVSFYIPPTGIEVIPLGENQYVRDAVTLERLEYCILKNEGGEKKYIHGPAVVFPQPDEEFVQNQDGGFKFRAIELSEISGIYVKVIADYSEEVYIPSDDEDELEEKAVVVHKTGEELFITGKDQMIYYPRPEHALIDYDGKVIHHAIAIPEGEGRYVLNRLTGDVKMVRGPIMYLPDPRYEVIVRRKLTKKQCQLWYPNNKEVLEYNVGIEEKEVPLNFLSVKSLCESDALTLNCCETSQSSTLSNGFYGQGNAVTDKKTKFSRGNTYTKPRTITIDNKFDGVVTIDVWTGYAINVISKNGNRKVILGPQTYLLEYDETLEVVNNEVFLRVENNVVPCKFGVITKDFVNVSVGINAYVDFEGFMKDKWFSIDNYADYLTSHLRSLLKKVVKKVSIEEFIDNAMEIISTAILSEETTYPNGMIIKDVDVTDIIITDTAIGNVLAQHQTEVVNKMLQLSLEKKTAVVSAELAELEKQRLHQEYETKMLRAELEQTFALDEEQKSQDLERINKEHDKANLDALQEIETLKSSIVKIELLRKKEEQALDIENRKNLDKLDMDREKARTSAIKEVVASISPDLISALTTSAQSEALITVAESLSPYALAKGESVTEVATRLTKGTSLEEVIGKLISK